MEKSQIVITRKLFSSQSLKQKDREPNANLRSKAKNLRVMRNNCAHLHASTCLYVNLITQKDTHRFG